MPDGVLRIDGAVGLDLDDQLVEVRALLYARAVDDVGDPTDRAERSGTTTSRC